MPRKVIWTEGQDAQIRRLRTEGASWDLIAIALGLARWTVIERGRTIGVHEPPRTRSQFWMRPTASRCPPVTWKVGVPLTAAPAWKACPSKPLTPSAERALALFHFHAEGPEP